MATAQKKRGGVVTRRLWLDTAAADDAREASDFPGLRVDRQGRGPDGAVTSETRSFASSLEPAWVPAHRLLELVSVSLPGIFGERARLL